MSGLATANSRAGRNLPLAIAVGLGLVGIIAFSLWCCQWLFVLVEIVAVTLGCIEIRNVAAKKQIQIPLSAVVVSAILLILIPWVIVELNRAGIAITSYPSPTIAMWIFAAAIFFILSWRIPKGINNYILDAGTGIFTLCYTALLGSCVTFMLAAAQGELQVCLYIFIVIGTDTGGYAVGILCGKHKMIPTISPKKTWEGFAGSLSGAVAVALGFGYWFFNFHWWQATILGLAVALAAIIGDIVASMIKRDADIKDMSNFIPGHGGVMDRLDSLLMAAPVAWLLFSLLL